MLGSAASFAVAESERFERARELLGQTLDNLRELAAGLHPREVTQGLAAALAALAAAARWPLTWTLRAPSGSGTRTALYYVSAEALATRSRRLCDGRDDPGRGDAAPRDDRVADDGIGGADVAHGSGLRGLIDRVEALDGRVDIGSPAGGGTRISVELPVMQQAAAVGVVVVATGAAPSQVWRTAIGAGQIGEPATMPAARRSLRSITSDAGTESTMKSTTMHRIVALAATAATFGAACGGDASSAEKSGGEAAPLTLRLGTVEGQEFPYAPYIDEFVRSVEETSGGSLDVEVAWEAVPWNPESEQTLATMVSDGDIDLALVPTRVWDELGVSTMRALQAPFLVDNLELLNAIVGSELADELFAGLDTLGVEGLALWPDALRHPFGFERPLLTANDFDGAQLRVSTSDASFRLLRALGAEPVAVDFSAGVPAGIDGAEAAFNVSRTLPALGTFIANITFYPKVNALVANAESIESLSDDHRDVLRRAATDTIAFAVDTNRTEHDLAEQYCADGGSVALTDAADLAELAELAAPVVAELEADETTRRIVDAIRELKSTVTADSATAAAACGPAVEEASNPTGSESDADVPRGGVGAPDGVYRVEISLDDVEAAGLTNAAGPTGIWTLEVDDGTYVHSCVPLDLPGKDCGNAPSGGIFGGGHLRGNGNTVWFVHDDEMISELRGCELPATGELGHRYPSVRPLHGLVVDGDTLTFTTDAHWANSRSSRIRGSRVRPASGDEDETSDSGG